MQGQRLFLFIWQFCVPEAVCIYAYWKILMAVLRQRKVNHNDGPENLQTAREPVAGTSGEMTMATNTGSSSHKSRAGNPDRPNKVALPPGSRGHRQKGGQSTVLSQAKLNIIRTMIYIVVCFTVCIMPRSVYITYMSLTVKAI